ncbi:MAG: MtrB/PioB family decaheme-associated outer membrane protein [Rubrivivax sp.]|nr:MtrB/PioB family decaheme-associated outer membrane protein [Rubrivivax sp.]
MKTPRPLLLAAALGALGLLAPLASALAAPVDTAAWKCTACPYDKGASGSVEAGIGSVSDRAVKYIDRTGLDKGTHLMAGGSLRYADDGGVFGSLWATDLGLDTRALGAEIGLEGRVTFKLAYDEMVRRFGEGAATPYLGSGGSVLTLPAGYPAESAGTMPLATTLNPVTLGYERSRLDAGLSFFGGERWTYRVNARRDERQGSKAGAGAFFATTAQLAVPLDHVTDQIEVSAAYTGRALQATLAYHLSSFRNGQTALSFANPFTPVVAGANNGQLALPPDNEFHQVAATVGYDINPQFRASADLAVGRMTQNAAYLQSTLTPSLAAGLPALPASSLNGRADTLNASVKLTVTPIDGLRVNGSYTRDVRDSDTPVLSYAAVATDMFVGLRPVDNRPASHWQDRIKLIADYRVSASLKGAAGLEHDSRERAYSEAVTTRETTVWGKVTGQPRDDLSLSLKVARAKRGNSEYGVSTWTDTLQNPLLRKYNLAQRDRLASTLRIDWTASETLSLGLGVDVAADNYRESAIGLKDGRSLGLTGDIAWAVTAQTQLRFYAQGETIRSHQAGSQLSGSPDWSGRVKDKFHVLGFGAKHMAMDDKLELDADITTSRARSDTRIETATATPPFPEDRTAIESIKLGATYQLNDKLSLMGSVWRENYDGKDWRLDGVQADTVPYLLALGQLSPNYRVNVVRLALRYRY